MCVQNDVRDTVIKIAHVFNITHMSKNDTLGASDTCVKMACDSCDKMYKMTHMSK